MYILALEKTFDSLDSSDDVVSRLCFFVEVALLFSWFVDCQEIGKLNELADEFGEKSPHVELELIKQANSILFREWFHLRTRGDREEPNGPNGPNPINELLSVSMIHASELLHKTISFAANRVIAIERFL